MTVGAADIYLCLHNLKYIILLWLSPSFLYSLSILSDTPPKLVVVYRGKHCPICTKYLNQLETIKSAFFDTGVDIIAISGDSKQQLEEHLEKLTISFPIAYGLTIEQMQTLGLYISDPRSEKETDHPFAEPGVFVINAEGEIQIIDISNAPFVRPELEALANGLSFIQENDYPIHGTHE